MITVQGVRDQTVAVLGLGRSGKAAAAALRAGGARVLTWDDGADTRETARDEGWEVVDLTKGATWHEHAIATLITSPGIAHLYPHPHPAIRLAYQQGVPVDNDVGLFFRSFATPDWGGFTTAPRVIAITGSNGKSTVTALVYHILQHLGRPVQMGGNIGTGVLSLDPATDGEVVVLELSSYQTDLARALTPDVAVLTNMSPDHLDRHGGPGGYFAAKRRLFAEGGPDRAVIGVDEDEGLYLAGQMGEAPADDRVIRISSGQKLQGKGWSVFARRGFLAEWRRGRQIASIDLRQVKGLPGAHNHQNACAAYAALRAIGIAPRQIEAGMESFAGLPHRSQLIAESGGVAWVNDSKATNVASAANALRAFPKIRWIAGGLGKDGGIADLQPDLASVVKAYLIGHSAREFALQMGDTPHEVVGDMAAAVHRAHAEALPGETVLLAPAAASFDQYPDFEKRGEDFIRLVRHALGQGVSD